MSRSEKTPSGNEVSELEAVLGRLKRHMSERSGRPLPDGIPPEVRPLTLPEKGPWSIGDNRHVVRDAKRAEQQRELDLDE